MAEKYRSPDDYLERLRDELTGADPALIQDALNDARDHINSERAALAAAARGPDENIDEAKLARHIVNTFGSPHEVAEAYRETERMVAAALAANRPKQGRGTGSIEESTSPPVEDLHSRFTGVLTDPKAYGACLFMMFALPTGLLYLAWALIGTVLSLGLSLIVIGLPFALFFLATIRAISLIEGRLVETLLGERMPRRAEKALPSGSWFRRIRYWLGHKRTWSTLAYMVLRFPLGVISFTVFTTLAAIVYAFSAGPIVSLILDEPFISIGDFKVNASFGLLPLGWLISAFVAFVSLHLATWFGRFYGWLAKRMLVRA